MPKTWGRFAVFALGTLLLSIAARADDPKPATAPGPGAAPAPVSNAITVNPSVTTRGSSFEVFVAGAPSGASKVKVLLDGIEIPTVVRDQRNPGAITATVTPLADSSGKQVIPLGSHHVSVMFDGKWYTAATTLNVVRPEQFAPGLRQAEPFSFTPTQKNRRMVLSGSNFVTDHPEDNQILIDGAPLPVVWDGCDHLGGEAVHVPPGQAAKQDDGRPHGEVNSNGTAITLCGFALPTKPSAEVAVRQGDVVTPVQTLQIPPWTKTSIVLMSVAVNLLCAAMVLFLAWFVRKARIGKHQYGMFRILFLDPETNSYSLSKYQFYMWTGAAIFTYAYLAISRIFVQQGSLPDIPGTLPAIIGLGAGTSIGAQLVTGVRGPKGGGTENPNLGDFITSGGVAAPERVQMFVWTTVGVIGFCLATLRADPWSITELPQIGTGLLYLMGLSSAGYLGGKLVRKPGPVINEISITPARTDDGPSVKPDLADAQLTQVKPVAAQPVAAAQVVLDQAQADAKALATATSTGALKACQDAIEALRLSIKSASAGDPDAVAVISARAVDADLAARAAAELFAATGGTAGNATNGADDGSGPLAEIAERCASAVQDLNSGVGQATGSVQATAVVAAAAAADSSAPTMRSIELRGRNLSKDAMFEINDMELPFRMLVPVNGARAPEIVAREDDSNASNMARELRLSIVPATLATSDRASYDSWFSKPGGELRFTVTNPDGQRSEITFSVPPGSHQSTG